MNLKFKTRTKQTSSRASGGFTLTEILVVILILAVLAVVGLSITRTALRSAAVANCSNNLRQIGIGLALHQAEFNRFPSAKDATTWDRAILPYLGYSGARSIAGNTAFDQKAWAEIERTAEIFKCPADKKPRRSNRFTRSYAIVPWTTNWSNGTSFRGWKGRPYNTGVPIVLVDNPARAAVVVEWHQGTEGIPSELGSGAHEHHDSGGPATPGSDLHSEKQIVLFADGHTEAVPLLSTQEFVKKYWPGTIGSVN